MVDLFLMFLEVGGETYIEKQVQFGKSNGNQEDIDPRVNND